MTDVIECSLHLMVILLRLVEAVVSICNGERRQWVVSCDWRRSGNGSLDTTMC
jgi:hypothetical protein